MPHNVFVLQTTAENNEMFGLECSIVRSRDMDVDSDRRRLEWCLWNMWIWRIMEKVSCLDKDTNEEVLRMVNKDRTGKYWTLFDKGNIDGLATFETRHFAWHHWRQNERQTIREMWIFECYMIWQLTMLQSNGQQRTGKDGYPQRKDVGNLLHSRRLLMMTQCMYDCTYYFNTATIKANKRSRLTCFLSSRVTQINCKVATRPSQGIIKWLWNWVAYSVCLNLSHTHNKTDQ